MGVYFHGLTGDAFLFLPGNVLECSHVVQTVSELDDDDTDIASHGQEHFAQIFQIELFLGSAELDLSEFGDAIDEVCDLAPEFFFDFRQRDLGILWDIMEKPCCYGPRIHADLAEGESDGEAVGDIGFSGTALLFPMGLFGESVCFGDQFFVIAGKRRASGRQDFFESGSAHMGVIGYGYSPSV